GVLQPLRPRAVDELGQVHLEYGAPVRERYVRAHPGAHLDRDPELLDALADERLRLGLPRLHLPAGELPTPRDLGRVGTRTGENATILDNRRADDDPLYGPFGLHEGSACQTKEKLGVHWCPQLHQMTRLWLWTHDGQATTLGAPNHNGTATNWPQAGNDAMEVSPCVPVDGTSPL